MEIGGYNDVPDWPKMGPSLLIATALIVAIRTRGVVTNNRRENQQLRAREGNRLCSAGRASRSLRTHERKSFNIPEKETAVVQSNERR